MLLGHGPRAGGTGRSQKPAPLRFLALALALQLLNLQLSLGQIWQVSTVAGSGGDSGSSDGLGSTARFASPWSAALSLSQEMIFVADRGNGLIRSVSLSSQLASTVATVEGGGCPAGVAQASESTLVFSDACTHSLSTVNLTSGQSAALAGGGVADFRNGAPALFHSPSGVAISRDGLTVYIADTGNRRIRAVGIASGAASTLAGSGESGSADGSRAGATFVEPVGLALSADGLSVFVADSSGGTVRRVTLATGAVATVPGPPPASMPTGLGPSVDGELLLIAGGNSIIYSLNLRTGQASTLAGWREGYLDAQGAAAEFNKPASVFFASNERSRIIVVDTGNHALRQIGLVSGPPPVFSSCSDAAGCQCNLGGCACGTYYGMTCAGQCCPCPKGHYCDCGSACNGIATPCPDGTASSAVGATSEAACTACTEEGMTCPQGSAAPVPCTAGYYCLVPGTADEIPCPTRTYSAAGSSRPEHCILCPGGTYNPHVAQAACQQCPGGSYCPQGAESPVKCARGQMCPPGAGQATPCDKSSYQPSAGATSCMPCPAGFRTGKLGAILQQECSIAPETPAPTTQAAVTTNTTTPKPLIVTTTAAAPPLSTTPSPVPKPLPPTPAPTTITPVSWASLDAIAFITGFGGVSDFECCHRSFQRVLEVLSKSVEGTVAVTKVCESVTCSEYPLSGGGRRLLQAGQVPITVFFTILAADATDMQRIMYQSSFSYDLGAVFSDETGRKEVTVRVAPVSALPQITPRPNTVPPSNGLNSNMAMLVAVCVSVGIVAIGGGGIWFIMRRHKLKRRAERARKNLEEGENSPPSSGNEVTHPVPSLLHGTHPANGNGAAHSTPSSSDSSSPANGNGASHTPPSLPSSSPPTNENGAAKPLPPLPRTSPLKKTKRASKPSLSYAYGTPLADGKGEAKPTPTSLASIWSVPTTHEPVEVESPAAGVGPGRHFENAGWKEKSGRMARPPAEPIGSSGFKPRALEISGDTTRGTPYLAGRNGHGWNGVAEDDDDGDESLLGVELTFGDKLMDSKDASASASEEPPAIKLPALSDRELRPLFDLACTPGGADRGAAINCEGLFEILMASDPEHADRRHAEHVFDLLGRDPSTRSLTMKDFRIGWGMLRAEGRMKHR